MGNQELLKAIVHYQQCLEKYTSRNAGNKMLYCITKLYTMPITVEHLEETGVGRTVNALRKMDGEVGDAAKSLVAKWKQMVAGGPATNDSTIKTESSKSHKNELKDKYKEKSSSSHRGDPKNKYEDKIKSSTSSYNEEEPVYHRKENEETKHRKHEKRDRKDNESKIRKHKSSKRKHDSDNSESEESAHENTDDDDDDEDDENDYDDYKRKLSKSKDNDSSNEEEEYYHKVKKDKDSRRHKSSKRKRDDDDSESEDDEVNIRHKKYSDENQQSEEDYEEIETKKHSSKHHRQREEHKHESREKSKRESKHKEKKIEKEYTSEDSTKRDASSRSKDKHSSKDKSKSSSSNKKHKEDKSPDKKSKHSSSKHHTKDKEHKSKNNSPHSSKGKMSLHENGIDSGSGASFAEALGMITPSSSKASKKKIAIIHPFPVEKPKVSKMSPERPKPENTIDLLTAKKLEPLDINVANLLPEITPNYRPLGNHHMDNGHKNKIINDDEALFAILNAKISRTKVFSGNKVIWGKVPSLFDLCTHVLQDNIDALEYTGGVPFSILKPVLERASADQLFTLEHHNPYLIEDTDELWQFHCQKEFRTKRREEMETWRDMYMRCLDEREAKLKALTANIKQSQDKSLPVRQTKLAYVDSIVKPPRAILRKQAKHGTGGSDKKPLVTPSSRLSALATAGAAGQIAVPNPGSRGSSSSGNSSAAMKVKKAPLMQKTLALMKNRCFRR